MSEKPVGMTKIMLNTERIGGYVSIRSWREESENEQLVPVYRYCRVLEQFQKTFKDKIHFAVDIYYTLISSHTAPGLM